MAKTLTEIAQELKNSEKKVQLVCVISMKKQLIF